MIFNTVTQTTSTISTLIQLSVAPVFLIAGVAGLLNIFISRLTRTVDKLEEIDKLINENEDDEEFCKKESEFLMKKRGFLIQRIQNINWAILFTTATGLMVALVIISVFYSSLMSINSEMFISISFILAMIFLIFALILFLREIYFTNLFIKAKKDNTHT